jgi:hypothetical protein
VDAFDSGISAKRCFKSQIVWVPPLKHPLALGAAASRFWVPQGSAGAILVTCSAEILFAAKETSQSSRPELAHQQSSKNADYVSQAA